MGRLRYVEVMLPVRRWSKNPPIDIRKIPFRALKPGHVFRIKGIWYDAKSGAYYKDKQWRIDCDVYGVRGDGYLKGRSRCGGSHYVTKAMKKWQQEAKQCRK